MAKKMPDQNPKHKPAVKLTLRFLLADLCVKHFLFGFPNGTIELSETSLLKDVPHVE